jgi:hypothetical protein
MAPKIIETKGINSSPPKNLQFLMLILNELKEVESRTKLLKMHYLIEEEGHVKFNLPLEDREFGPVDFASLDYARENGFIIEEAFMKGPYITYKTKITDVGETFFEEVCKPLISEVDFQNAKKIIKKYEKYTRTDILSYVHSRYVDIFKLSAQRQRLILESSSMIKMFISLVENQLKIEKTDKTPIYEVLAHLYHIQRILSSLEHLKNQPSKIGSIINTVNEYMNILKISKYRLDPTLVELFDFLDNYACKEKICDSIFSEDFSDIPEGDRERIASVLAQM